MFIDGSAPPIGPPDPATNPEPSNGATGVTTTPTLTWLPGPGADTHNVYFGPSSDPLDFQGNQSGTSFTPGPLDLNTTYHWRIDEVNDEGTTTGPEWFFTTRSAEPTTMHVHSIVLDTVRANPPLSSGRASVVVVDDLGDVVQGASVTGTFTDSLNEILSATTGGDGAAVLITSEEVKKPSFTFRVDDVSIDGLTYAAGDNVITEASYP